MYVSSLKGIKILKLQWVIHSAQEVTRYRAAEKCSRLLKTDFAWFGFHQSHLSSLCSACPSAVLGIICAQFLPIPGLRASVRGWRRWGALRSPVDFSRSWCRHSWSAKQHWRLSSPRISFIISYILFSFRASWYLSQVIPARWLTSSATCCYLSQILLVALEDKASCREFLFYFSDSIYFEYLPLTSFCHIF